VQQHQHRFAGIAGTEIAGPDPRRVQVSLLKRDALEIAPYALELRHSSAQVLSGHSAVGKLGLDFKRPPC
jgi:hypothetical protein